MTSKFKIVEDSPNDVVLLLVLKYVKMLYLCWCAAYVVGVITKMLASLENVMRQVDSS